MFGDLFMLYPCCSLRYVFFLNFLRPIYEYTVIIQKLLYRGFYSLNQFSIAAGIDLVLLLTAVAFITALWVKMPSFNDHFRIKDEIKGFIIIIYVGYVGWAIIYVLVKCMPLFFFSLV